MNKKKQRVLVLIVLSFSAIFFTISCSKSTTNNNPPPPPVNCDSSHIKYATDVTPILKSNCYSCHGKDSTTGSAGILLEGYSNLQPFASDGSLKGAITHASGYQGMPYLKPKLDSCTINKILDWISEAAPNN